MKTKQIVKKHPQTPIGIRFAGMIALCLQFSGCAVEDIENFSSAMNSMNNELGYSESSSSYGSQYSNYGSQYSASSYNSGDSEEVVTTQDNDDNTASVSNQEQVSTQESPKTSSNTEKTSASYQIHVYAIAYGMNSCGQETALGYEYSIVDADSEVQEKRRLESSLQSRYSGVSRCRSSSSKFDFGKSAKAVILISWQGGTKKCPATVYSYVYGLSTEDASTRAQAKFKLWAPGEATMHTVDLRRFVE
ncbi:MAG: hypothetical protein RLZZ245_2313 [Verrucomicrobiota bacterium]